MKIQLIGIIIKMEKDKIEYLNNILNKFLYLKEKIFNLSNFSEKNNIDLYKQYASLEKLVSTYLVYKDILKNINNTKHLIESEDKELKILALEELEHLKKKKEKYENNINNEFFNTKETEINNIYLEIRSATGGNESAIFVEDLFKMYIYYINNLNYKYSLMSFSIGNTGGYKDITIRISGWNVFDKFKYESGVHRVQRIPKTDSHGRVHTSTCSVVILPEVKIIDSIKIENNDIRIDTFRSSGAGGQHVNVTDSAVRIIHIPTGIVAECQSERSQHKNKQKAFSLLMSRLLDRERTIQKSNLDFCRKKLVGMGSRPEKIRTYNYTENRVTDHRLNITIYRLSDIIEGRLDLIIDKFYVKSV